MQNSTEEVSTVLKENTVLTKVNTGLKKTPVLTKITTVIDHGVEG
jgi:hypothetical protein